MDNLDTLVRLIVGFAGLWLIGVALRSAVRNFVLPRNARDWLSYNASRVIALVFFTILRFRRAGYDERDRVMAFFAPTVLLLLPAVYLSCIALGYALIYWALGVGTLFQAFVLSGSSLLTLGFAAANDSWLLVMLEFTEATVGLVLVAILIAYIPVMYTAFSKRELAVTMLESRAGAPAFVTELLTRYHALQRLDRLTDLWTEWEAWFAEIEESHTSLVALIFFRSPQSHRSWVTAAGAVLDAAAFVASTLDQKRDVQAELCIRAGYLCLRRIAGAFDVPYNPDPRPTDPISIARDEYDAVYDTLAAIGVSLKPDRDQAWHDFAGWRVNYDLVLLALAAITMAPYAPWISDRSLRRGGAGQRQRLANMFQRLIRQ